MCPNKHSVFIVCDQQLIRLGIKLLINQQSDLEVIGEANDCQKAVALLRNQAPMVVILIADAARIEIPTAVFRLKIASPQSDVLVVADTKEMRVVHQFLKAGASGHLLTSVSAEDLFQMIRSFAASGGYIEHGLIAGLTSISQSWQVFQGMKIETRLHLSEREEEVLRFLLSGYKSREIADQLSINSKTVDTYCARVMKKLGLHHRKDVIRYGISQGWLNGEPN
jgi:DNA-binding NarL/FixJ family response regulator